MFIVVEAAAACQNVLSKEGLSEKVLLSFVIAENALSIVVGWVTGIALSM